MLVFKYMKKCFLRHLKIYIITFTNINIDTYFYNFDDTYGKEILY